MSATHPTSTASLRLPLAGLGGFVALLGAAAAALGVFARGDGSFVTVSSARGETYEMATSGIYANNALQLVAEGVGWDVFTLLVAAPALLIAAVAMWRGSYRATLVVAGLFGYFAYLHLEYAVTWAFGPPFPLFVVLLAASVTGIIGAGSLLAAERPGRFDDRFPRRAWALLSIGMSALLVVMWSGRIVAALGAPDAGQLHGHTTMTVQALDLGLVVPVAVVIAVVALRRRAAGEVAAAAFVVTFAAMSAAIMSMMISSWIVTGVPAVEPIVIFGLATIASLTVGVRMFRSITLIPSDGPTSVDRSVGRVWNPLERARGHC